MASYQESQKKRKIALRKFNDYYNSFIDDHGEEIVGEKTKIRALIEEIRKLNRHLAENDSLFDETLVEQFNSDAHRLAKFLNETQSMNIVNDKVEESNNDKRPTAETRRNQKQEIHNIENNDNNFDMIQTDKNIDALLNNYYINRLKLTNTNWLD
ncbi:hypothetical protein BLA29_006054, partial [Euroglyphus maynei]